MSLDEIPDPSQSKFWYMYMYCGMRYMGCGVWEGGATVVYYSSSLYMAFDLIKAGKSHVHCSRPLMSFYIPQHNTCNGTVMHVIRYDCACDTMSCDAMSCDTMSCDTMLCDTMLCAPVTRECTCTILGLGCGCDSLSPSPSPLDLTYLWDETLYLNLILHEVRRL